jgi:nucleoid DNA-binding protein
LSNRDALQIVNATFVCLKEALLRREPVNIEGFGRWYVEEVTRRRSWRFGKIIISKPYKVSFEIDGQALARAKAEPWCPHPSWEVQRNHEPKLRGRKLVAFLEEQERQRRSELLDEYKQIILRFLQGAMCGEDPLLFWTLRHGSWFHGAVSEVPAGSAGTVSINEAPRVITSTKPKQRSRGSANTAIEGIQWYARWSTRLKVERDLWQEAERTVADMTVRGRWC